MQTEPKSIWRRGALWIGLVVVAGVVAAALARPWLFAPEGTGDPPVAPSAAPAAAAAAAADSGPLSESETAAAFANALSESPAGNAGPASARLDAPAENQKTLQLLDRPMGDMTVLDSVMRVSLTGDNAKAMLMIDEQIAKEPKRSLWHFAKGMVASRSMQLYTAEESFVKAEMYLTANSSENRFIEGWVRYWRAANGLTKRDNSEAIKALHELVESKYNEAGEAAKVLLAEVEKSGAKR